MFKVGDLVRMTRPNCKYDMAGELARPHKVTKADNHNRWGGIIQLDIPGTSWWTASQFDYAEMENE